MAKITVMKKVYWDTGGRRMSGVVKQIMSDHVLVKADGADYMVSKSALSTKPLGAVANLVREAAFKDDPKAPVAIEYGFDPVTGESNAKWVDPTDPKTGRAIMGCNAKNHPEIGICDAIWNEDTETSFTEINPELLGGPKQPPAGVAKPAPTVPTKAKPKADPLKAPTLPGMEDTQGPTRLRA